ncbi:MAG: hypothetical protein Kow0098_14170 [Ignavibacteriaceae bacterium]
MKLKPDWWDFTVIFDPIEALNHFHLSPESNKFSFRVKETKSFTLNILDRKLIYQNFPFTSLSYDLLIVGNAMNNIAYPLSFFRILLGKKIAYWGHGRDFFTVDKSLLKKSTEKIKTIFSRRASGFFAYTPGVKSYLVSHGVPESKIHTLYNTIDIMHQREKFDQLRNKREQIRVDLKLKNRKVLLYVGRFNKEKRIDYLLKSFEILYRQDKSYKLLLIGGGDTKHILEFIDRLTTDAVDYLGVVDEEKIATYYTASDLFVYPGAVGLGPIQAMCYDLIPVVINSDIHSPEYEYLSENNALILPIKSDENKYADAIADLMQDKVKFIRLRQQIWSSINHLTISRMAENFINGINFIFKES